MDTIGFCPHCGAARNGQSTCAACGARFGGIEVPASPQSPAANTLAPAPAQAWLPATRASSGSGRIALIALGVVAIAAVAGIGFLLVNRSSGSTASGPWVITIDKSALGGPDNLSVTFDGSVEKAISQDNGTPVMTLNGAVDDFHLPIGAGTFSHGVLDRDEVGGREVVNAVSIYRSNGSTPGSMVIRFATDGEGSGGKPGLQFAVGFSLARDVYDAIAKSSSGSVSGTFVAGPGPGLGASAALADFTQLGVDAPTYKEILGWGAGGRVWLGALRYADVNVTDDRDYYVSEGGTGSSSWTLARSSAPLKHTGSRPQAGTPTPPPTPTPTPHPTAMGTGSATITVGGQTYTVTGGGCQTTNLADGYEQVHARFGDWWDDTVGVVFLTVELEISDGVVGLVDIQGATPDSAFSLVGSDAKASLDATGHGTYSGNDQGTYPIGYVTGTFTCQ